MINILNKFHINNYTYIFLLVCFLSGFIKNILVIFFICILHELGHVFFIKLFKYNIIKVEIFPFGGFTTIDKLINSTIYKDLMISLGGIIIQLILFLILYIFKNNISYNLYNLLVYYNFLILIFNLLPIVPLDGSKIFNLILDKFFSFKTSFYLNTFISIGFLITFIFINYFYNYDNYFIIAFLVFQLVIHIKEFNFLYNKFLLERYLYNLDYKKIKYNTKEISDLRKEVYHYFNDKKNVVSEKKKLSDLFDKSSNF